AILVGLMALLERVPRQGRQVPSGIVLAFGFALGAFLTALNPSEQVSVTALLVGSPLSVNKTDIAVTGAVVIFTVLVLATTRRSVLFQTFDPVGFQAAGFRSTPVDLAVTLLIAAAVVVSL